MGEKWEIVTPGPPPPAHYDGGRLPGAQTISARRMAPQKTPSKKEQPKTRWSQTKRVFSLVPWGALVACAFLLTGISIFLAHASKAADKSKYVLELAESDMDGLYPSRLKKFSGGFAVTAGLAGGCLGACAFLAFIRLLQKLSVEKMERWGKFKFRMAYFIGILAFLAIILPSIWFILNCMFLSAWGMGLYTLRDASSIASVNMQQVDMTTFEPGTMPLAAVDGVCPSMGCFNMQYFTWLVSTSCLCTQQLVEGMQEAARDALNCTIWSLAASGCLWFGSLLAAAQGAADLALFRAVWLSGVKAPQPSPAKRPPQFDDYEVRTPGLSKRNLYPVDGHPGYYSAGPPPGSYYVRSP